MPFLAKKGKKFRWTKLFFRVCSWNAEIFVCLPKKVIRFLEFLSLSPNGYIFIFLLICLTVLLAYSFSDVLFLKWYFIDPQISLFLLLRTLILFLFFWLEKKKRTKKNFKKTSKLVSSYIPFFAPMTRLSTDSPSPFQPHFRSERDKNSLFIFISFCWVNE